ncbi:MAG TPA: methyltransferase domain-containing protein [Polyangia bacterium]|jgi:trans-aconitate 2-methyltransferase|nr:methyltransferase domain-containing protein [Polyangia bacterium]
MTWDPKQYERFAGERSQPFADLLGLVRPRPGMRVIDLGCGTGRLTRDLHERLEAASTLGMDNSEEMLAQARPLVEGARDGLSFAPGDIGTEFAAGANGPYDLIFSHAALHWVDDHPALLGRLTALLAPGGQLAVQVPANHDHISHEVAATLAGESPFREALGGYVRHSPVLSPRDYAALLDRLGYREQHVRLQVYGHHLASRDEVAEWTRGTTLTVYRARLPGPLYEEFLARYRARLAPLLEDTRPYFYPFARILFWGQRA